MLKIEHLNKNFKTKEVLKDLNLEVHDGSIFGLVGINGAGKSTLLRLIAGVYEPEGGSITLNGTDTWKDPEIRRDIAFVSDEQYYPLGCTIQSLKLLYESMYNFDEAVWHKYMEMFDRYGEVKIKDSIIQSFEEKRHVDKGYINGGIYYLPKNIFDKYELPHKFSLEADFFTPYMKELGIKAYMTNSYFLDIGIPSDYQKAQDDFKKKKALFLDRDGVINIDYGHVHTIDKFEFTPFIFNLAKKYYDLGYLIIVITNQAGVAKKLYPIDDVYTINSYMFKEFKKHGIELSAIYFCPHQDSDNCTCRKPKPGMFKKAVYDFNINVDESIAIGDKMSDLIAANSIGVKELYFYKTQYEEEKVDFNYKKLDV